MEDIKITVNSIKHLPKCARCYKHSEDVDTDQVFPMTCNRCSSVMHELFYNVNFGININRFPKNLTRNVDEFIQKFVRSELHHLNWQQINEKYIGL